MQQLTHHTTKFIPTKFPIILLCDNVNHAPNIGSLFRIADAFGINTLILCGKNITLGRKMAKTSRATQNVVNFKIEESAHSVAQYYKNLNYHIIALEITGQSKPLHKTSFIKNKPIVLVVGNENFGVDESILKCSNQIIHIEMFGHNSSMNVVQATNIALYEITKQIR